MAVICRSSPRHSAPCFAVQARAATPSDSRRVRRGDGVLLISHGQAGFCRRWQGAESVEIAIARAGIGFASLVCDRGYRPLRWKVSRKHGNGFPSSSGRPDRWQQHAGWAVHGGGFQDGVAVFLAAGSTTRSTWGHSSQFLPVIGTKVITRRLAVSSSVCVARPKRDVHHADVQLLTIGRCSPSH
jgi:hypothetical protein